MQIHTATKYQNKSPTNNVQRWKNRKKKSSSFKDKDLFFEKLPATCFHYFLTFYIPTELLNQQLFKHLPKHNTNTVIST